MYAPVAIPLRRTPESMTAYRAANPWTDGMSASTTSITNPTTITLLSVPIPGRWWSGIHTIRTSTPTMITHVPTPSPSLRDSPWCSTSHGSTPRPAINTIAPLTPYRTSPA
jgi:hypothetical protein